jgi:hypothetical protein
MTTVGASATARGARGNSDDESVAPTCFGRDHGVCHGPRRAGLRSRFGQIAGQESRHGGLALREDCHVYNYTVRPSPGRLYNNRFERVRPRLLRSSDGISWHLGTRNPCVIR